MSEIATFAYERRESFGKNEMRRLRAAGRVPGNLYGLKQDPAPVSVDDHDFRVFIRHHGTSGIIMLQAPGKAEDAPCVIRELQRDPVTGALLHIDLQRLNLKEKSHFEVEVIPVGEPIGVREGGVLETHTRVLEVLCLPSDLPTEFEVSIESLAFGHSLTAGDIELPDGVELLSEPTTVLFSVIAPAMEEEEEGAEEAVEGEVAEPEVIGEKDREEEGEAPSEG